MARRDVAMNRIGRASAWLNDADRWFGMDAEQFRAATKERDLAIFYLFLNRAGDDARPSRLQLLARGLGLH